MENGNDADRRDPPRLFDGRYQLHGRLGAGGMATVYLAEDTSLHRKVAIKVLAERYAEDEQFVERFRREAQSAAGLNHPNIVAIYDRGVAEGTYYIAMEYLDGPTLKDVIDERGGLEPNRAIGFATQILAALRFAHNHGVVHRDIKPHNVVVSPDGRLKVTDFGIARAGASQMTEVGSIVGTAQYLSPEQARGEVVGPPSDLYSVGIVLYEMLTGRVPFEGDSAVAIAMKHLSEEPVPPSVYAPGTPPALEQVVLRALAKDAGDRYQTAEEMSADLDRARRGVALSPRTEQMTRVIPPVAHGAADPRAAAARGTRVWDRELPPPVAAAPAAGAPRSARAGPGCCSRCSCSPPARSPRSRSSASSAVTTRDAHDAAGRARPERSGRAWTRPRDEPARGASGSSRSRSSGPRRRLPGNVMASSPAGGRRSSTAPGDALRLEGRRLQDRARDHGHDASRTRRRR